MSWLHSGRGSSVVSGFSRNRNAKLDRFTLDRLIAILGKLDENVDVNITFHSHRYETQDRPIIR